MPLSQYNVEQKMGNSFSHLPSLDLCVLYQKNYELSIKLSKLR